MSSDGSSSDSDVESEGESDLKQQVTALEETVSLKKIIICLF